MRKSEVAKLAGASEKEVHKVTAQEVREAYANNSAFETIIEVVTEQETAIYWRVGNSYYLDDSEFGDVVAIDKLDYNSDLGLHERE